MNYLTLFDESLKEQGQYPACFAFSIHKAGSSLMNSMIGAVCEYAGIPSMSIPDVLFRNGVRESEWRHDRRLLSLISDGRLYYGFRYLPEFMLAPSAWRYTRQSVLLVRDPRDALVSEYFSYGGQYFSHMLPNKDSAFVKKQSEMTKHLSIDEYVLIKAEEHLDKLNVYKVNLDFDKVLLRQYEQIYFDKRSFLADIFNHFGIPVSSDLIDRVALENDIRPLTEDPSQHIRKGSPGDHREKLCTETIEKLNDIFRDTCRWYGYDLDT